jgi:hypothetical protein
MDRDGRKSGSRVVALYRLSPLDRLTARQGDTGRAAVHPFFDRLHPFAETFMALFERGTLPHRSTLSRFLAAVHTSCLQALRTVFATSSFVWGWTQETIGGLWDLGDRSGQRYLVFDIDATREAARQRKLPTSTELPLAQRRLDALCGPGYLGHRRGSARAMRNPYHLPSIVKGPLAETSHCARLGP